MSWQDFDFFDSEKDEFGRSFYEVVLPIWDASQNAFEQRQSEIDAERDSALSKASDEFEVADAFGWTDYRKTALDEQKNAVGAALLNVLCSALKGSLRGMARYFDHSHPAKGDYRGDWLHKKSGEFKDRFGIDFEAGPVKFVRLEELVLARNAAIHPNDGTLKEYREKVPEPRFLANDRLSFEKPLLTQSFQDVNKFVEWVWTELKGKRTRRH